MTIHLARHGQTAYNHEGRFQGHLPVPLDATGREQAAELAEVAAGVEIVTLVCSPLARARETADIVAARIGLEPIEDARFAETDTGDWTDRSFAEVRAEDPDGLRALPALGPGLPLSRAASRSPSSPTRVQAGLADLRARPAALPALVVCHRGVIRLALPRVATSRARARRQRARRDDRQRRSLRGRPDEPPDGGRLRRPRVATFGAFFVAQRLKNAPPVLRGSRVVPATSRPTRDGRIDVAPRDASSSRRPTTSRVSVLDADGDEVRELLGGRRVPRATLVRLKWDGRNDDGARAPDGRYRYRITLQHEGRSVVPATSVRLDTTPPRPLVTSIGPSHALRARAAAQRRPTPSCTSTRPGTKPVIRLFKTGPGPTRLVLEDDSLRRRREGLDWDGTTPSGRPVSPGTYLVVDRDPRPGRQPRPLAAAEPPRPARDELRRHAARAAAASPSATSACARPTWPRPPGDPVEFFVDARRKPWTWSVRRVGSAPRRPAAARPRRACACTPRARVGRLPHAGAHGDAHRPRCPSRSRAPSATASSSSCRS